MDRRAFLTAAAACSAITASSSQFGARAQTLGRFQQAAAYSAGLGGASFLVARHGVVLGEEYPGGAVDARYQIGGGTRAFMALLVASLIEDNLLTLDEPVALTIGDWGADPVKSSISVRALVSGVSGLAFARRGPNDIATAIGLTPADNPGARFTDDPAAFVIMTEVARRKLFASGRDGDPARYLTDRTLAPIGCVPIGWTRDPSGAPRFDDGAVVSARGWAAAGELILRQGVWRAQQLVDDNALLEATRGSFAEARAGIGLWLAAAGRNGQALDVNSDLWRAQSPAPVDLAMAAGDGGQRLFIVPSQGLVVVRQSRTLDPNARWSDAQFLTLLWRDL